MKRKGQAALEFLTTYGWAFLIILVMIGAISYFGILNPSKLLPARCGVDSFSCEDYVIQIDSSADPPIANLKVSLKQTTGKSIYVQSFKCAYGEEAMTLAPTNGVTSNGVNLIPANAWSPKYSASFTCPVNSVAAITDQKVKVFFEIIYRTTATGFDHTSTGEVYVGVTA